MYIHALLHSNTLIIIDEERKRPHNTTIDCLRVQSPLDKNISRKSEYIILGFPVLMDLTH